MRAKERLDRRFGVKRRKIAVNLLEMEDIRPIPPEKSKDIENFADLLEVAVINFKEGGRSA